MDLVAVPRGCLRLRACPGSVRRFSTSKMSSRDWMYSSRLCNEYLSGVLSFINVAESNMKWQKMTYMVCPCVDCRNDKRFPHSMHIHAHLIMRGFKENYKIWNKHGEDGLNILETKETLISAQSIQKMTFFPMRTSKIWMRTPLLISWTMLSRWCEMRSQTMIMSIPTEILQSFKTWCETQRHPCILVAILSSRY
ncbi:uncharacterized protein LOC120654082 [Panicum virgatum]|uniref:uncharacterized protein LOC120654082 n=1 Tax=Panicum virgatum TaxID=38727 RepID=UPI0019D593BD|nr:uncharacterized protein LOC120654082 [Panicum virgatum]